MENATAGQVQDDGLDTHSVILCTQYAKGRNGRRQVSAAEATASRSCIGRSGEERRAREGAEMINCLTKGDMLVKGGQPFSSWFLRNSLNLPQFSHL